MRSIFPDKSIIPAFRRPKYLKEMLVPSKLKVQESDNNDQKLFIQSDTFTTFVTSKTYKIKQHLTCNSEAVNYLALM